METQSEERSEDRIRVRNFLNLLVVEAGPEKYKLPLSIGVSGVGIAGIVVIINTVIERGPREGVHFELLVFFVFCSSGLSAKPCRRQQNITGCLGA